MLVARRCLGLGRALSAVGSGAATLRLAGPEVDRTARAGSAASWDPPAASESSLARWVHRAAPAAGPDQQQPEAEQHQGAPLHGPSAAEAAAAWEESGQHEYGEYYDPQREAEEQRQRLLEASLTHVAQLGWSRAALAAGAADVGLSPSSAGLLSRGEVELVEHFMARCNRELEAALGGMAGELSGMRTTERVRAGVKLRLEMNAPYIDSWAQALSLQSQPSAAAAAARQRAEIADIIWHAAGDASTDYNWYTKRGLLAGVYCASELYMLTDTSPGFADTWAALDRRLADVLQLGKAARGVAALVQEAGAVLVQLAGGSRGGSGGSAGGAAGRS